MKFLEKKKLKKINKKAEALYQKRERGQSDDTDAQKEIAVHNDLAKFYKKHLFDKHYPHAEEYMLESYRVAASLHYAEAQYRLSAHLLERARFWQKIAKSMYASSIHQKYIDDTYKEAFAYLKQAEDQGHPLAIRMHGMAYIHGWGVEKDRDRGFQFIVDSIDEENAWDRATAIFDELDLNTPEFFSAIMSLRKDKK